MRRGLLGKALGFRTDVIGREEERVMLPQVGCFDCIDKHLSLVNIYYFMY